MAIIARIFPFFNFKQLQSKEIIFGWSERKGTTFRLFGCVITERDYLTARYLLRVSHHSSRPGSSNWTLLCPAAEDKQAGHLQRLIVLVPQLQVSVA